MSIPFSNDKIMSNNSYEFNINRWYGLNVKSENINDGECVSMKNINCNGTYLFPRPPREVIKEGILNPQKLFFCGDKLSYIDDGCLNVLENGEFVNKGNVGNVSSVVNFSNKEILFYPSNSKYNLDDNTLSQVNDYLKVEKEYTDADDIFILNEELRGYIMQISGPTDQYILLPELKNEDSTPKQDSDGNQLYGSVTFNASGIPNHLLEHPYHDTYYHNCRLIVYAYDKDNVNVLTNKYKVYAFGDEISIKDACKIAVYILVYKYNSRSTTTLAKCFEYSNQIINNPDFKVWLTASEYPAPNSCPHIDFACMDDNRVFGVSKNNIYASSLGNYANWSDFVDADGSPKTTGAYAEELYSLGDFTGVCKYRSNVILTKKDLLYECYGNKPPYRINLTAKSGCIDNRSIVEVNNILYWLGADGIYRFAGSVPIKISDKVEGLFSGFNSGVGATDGKNYYVSVDDGVINRLMVYDTTTGLWCMEDNLDVVDMTNFNHVVYALTKSGEILKFNSGNEFVGWEFETKDFNFGIRCKKIIRDLIMNVDIKCMSKIDIYIKYDNEEYTRCATYSANENTIASIKLKVKKCNSFKILIKGIGYAKINSLLGTIIMSSKNTKSQGVIRY